MEMALEDIMYVLELAQVQVELELEVIGQEVAYQLAEDDEIYTKDRTCTVWSSHSRNTLFHPVSFENFKEKIEFANFITCKGK